MASEEHLSLANTIKSMHVSLRLRAREVGFSEAWREHCNQSTKLQEYAVCMKELATAHWNKLDTVSRITWIVKNCTNYFQEEGFLREFNREAALCRKLDMEPHCLPDAQLYKIYYEKLELLDVGSCYNPFGQFSCFNVLPIDISPACDEVHKCDFLNVSISEDIPDGTSLITHLKANSFDIVVFSLFLEYLPCSERRYLCCQNAAQLLKPGGLLCIVTPDSKHATANAHIMKRWRCALAKLGLLSIKYEKLTHLHCMVFRKCFKQDLAIKWMSRALSTKKPQKEDLLSIDPHTLMVIPQDFHSYELNIKEKTMTESKSHSDYESTVALFEHLPSL